MPIDDSDEFKRMMKMLVHATAKRLVDGATACGMTRREILLALGYSEAQIDALFAKAGTSL